MPGNGRDFDIFHKTAQIISRRADQAIVIRVADPASAVLRLEKNRKRLSDLLRKIALLAGVGHALRFMRARGFHRVAELLRHGIGLRAGTAGIRKHVHGRKADPLQKRDRRRLISLRFTGEARDHVRRERTPREIPPQPPGAGKKLGRIVFAVHARERAVAAALQREVKMTADLPGRRGAAAEVLRDDRRFDRTCLLYTSDAADE